MTAPRRRFRFTLRTLLVVVTVFGVWLGYQLQAVRERAHLMNWIEGHGGIVNRLKSPTPVTAWPRGRGLLIDSDIVLQVLVENRDRNIPTWREWLGDTAVSWIALPDGASQSDLERATALFPEAVVHPMPKLSSESAEDR